MAHAVSQSWRRIAGWRPRVQVTKPSDITSADKLIFPGVGTYGQAMSILKQQGMVDALRDYVLVRRLPGLPCAFVVQASQAGLTPSTGVPEGDSPSLAGAD